MSIKHTISALTLGWLALAGTVRAQDRPIELTSAIELVRQTTDGESLSPATSVVPGDELEFLISYRNHTNETITDFVVVTPVSSNVVVSADTASRFDTSVDGGETFGAFAALKVLAEDGSERPATLDDITHLRWTVPSMGPGAGGEMHYRASVK